MSEIDFGKEVLPEIYKEIVGKINEACKTGAYWETYDQTIQCVVCGHVNEDLGFVHPANCPVNKLEMLQAKIEALVAED